MKNTIIITEEQKRRIISEMAKDEVDKTIQDNDSLIKRVVKQASEQINFDLTILATFSMSIGGLMGPVEEFLKGEFPTLSVMERSLLIAGISYQYILDNKEPLKKILSKIKDKGLIEIYNIALNKSEQLKNTFLTFIESLGISIKKTSNIIGYTFLIPIIPIIYNMVVSGGFDTNDIISVIKRVSGFVGLNIAGISLKELISLMVKRFKK